jgi:5-methylcytosine-specific restriction endonuclease McrA
MWTLTAQVLDGLDETLNTALTLRDGTPVYVLTPLERAAIHSVYQLYEQMAGQLQTAHLPVALAAARPRLYDAYDQVQIGGRLASFRSSLLASTTSCPYCGFGELKDLDHYLPRSIFGELAIYPNNLIPSCGPCNNAKRKIVPGQGPG